MTAQPTPPARSTAEDKAHILMQGLMDIASATPPCGDEATEAYQNRLWAGKYRDLQRRARATLQQIGVKVDV